jgi:hypothetical protein
MPRSATPLPIVTAPASSHLSAAITRRGILGRWGVLLGGALLGIQSAAVEAKRKKKKKAKKPRSTTLKTSDWNGVWTTRLSNGVSGSATLSYDTSIDLLYGTYRNSVGNGEFRCYPDTGAPFDCQGPYYQTDGSTGYISMSLQDAEHWYGTYQIDGGESGTWSGVR